MFILCTVVSWLHRAQERIQAVAHPEGPMSFGALEQSLKVALGKQGRIKDISKEVAPKIKD